MLKYTSLLLLLLLSNLHFALCQVHVPDAVEDETAKNSPSSEILEINFRVENKEVSVKLNIFDDSIRGTAAKLCAEPDLGVTEDRSAACIASVDQYLNDYVRNWLSERTFRSPLTFFGNTTINVRFRPDRDSIDSMAFKVCADSAVQEVMAANNGTEECPSSVKAYLIQSVRSWLESKSLSVPLTVNETRFDVRFFPQRDSPAQLATEVCTRYQKETGLLTQASFNTDCAEPAAKYLQQVSDSWIQERMIVVPLTLRDKEFTVRYMPEREDAVEISERLCVENADEIGGLTNENVNADCIQPVAEFLERKVNEWLQAKSIELKLTVNNDSFTVRFMPSRESSSSIARKLCVENAATIGNLTEENIVEACITPVTQRLESEVSAWLAEKEKSATTTTAAP
eukprot:gene31914-41405_t